MGKWIVSLGVLMGSLMIASASQPPEPGEETKGIESNAPLSAYVQRMLSLDRDEDGCLSADELPGKLAEILKEHDADGNQKLSASELGAVEDKARAARESSQAPRPSGRSPSGLNGRQGPRQRGTGTQASPLDTEQILRFALTFDADHDGGLNSAELKRYAAALAVRRAQGRQRSRVEDQETASESATPVARARKNSLDSSQDDESDSSRRDVKPQGLSADGKGSGGFGDVPR